MASIFKEDVDSWDEDCSRGEKVTDKRNPKKPLKEVTDKYTLYRIAHKFGFNKKHKERLSGGHVVVGIQFHDKKYKIKFSKLGYTLNGRGSKSSGQQPSSSYIFSLKTGRLEIYQLIPFGGQRKLKTISHSPSVVSSLVLKKASQIKRFVRVLNEFFKINKFLKRLKVKTWMKDGIQYDDLNERLLELMFAGLKYLKPYPSNGYGVHVIPTSISRHLRKEIGFKDLVKKVFGFNSAKIVKLVAQKIEKDKSWLVFGEGRLFKGLLSLDHWHAKLEGENLNCHINGPNIKAARTFLKDISLARRLYLIKDSGGFMWAKDIAQMYKDLRGNIQIPSTAKKWKDIHDFFSLEYHKLKTADRPIEYPKKFEKAQIDGAKVDDLIIELPKSTHKLIEYGQKLNHCVGAYGAEAVAARCQILAIYKGSELKYNLEIRNNRVNQFRGQFNCNPLTEDKEKVLAFLNERGITNDDATELAIHGARQMLNNQNEDDECPF